MQLKQDFNYEVVNQACMIVGADMILDNRTVLLCVVSCLSI